MVKCFIYYEISGPDNYKFQKEKIIWLKEMLPGIPVLDLDNRSDAMLQNQVLQLLQQDIDIVIFVDILLESEVRTALGFLERIAAASTKVVWITNLENRYIKILQKQYTLDCRYSSNRQDFQGLISKLAIVE